MPGKSPSFPDTYHINQNLTAKSGFGDMPNSPDLMLILFSRWSCFCFCPGCCISSHFCRQRKEVLLILKEFLVLLDTQLFTRCEF